MLSHRQALYLREQGHAWVVTLCDQHKVRTLYLTSRLVEVVATICRKSREQSITMAERDTLIDIFRQDSQLAYDVWPVTTAIYISAGNLCRSHKLRAYDAVQLACALSVRDDALTSHVTAPLFVCAEWSHYVAMAEGFSVENPTITRS